MAPKVEEVNEYDSGEPETAEETNNNRPSQKRNAFSELMSPKPKRGPEHRKCGTTSTSTASTNPPPWSFNLADRRNGLLPYMTTPESNPNNLVISYTDDFTIIRDAYPKATIHLLLLPRDMSKTAISPRTALTNDAAFLASVRAAATDAKALAAKELARLIGKHSATQQARTLAMESGPAEVDEASLTPGRDYASQLKVGIHAHPSMTHLHIHILSPDMHSPALRHRKHYNTFCTPFFVPLDDFPLAPDDERWRTSVQNANLDKDFVCWRCGRGLGRSFVKLKGHLEEEFAEWVKE